MLPMFTQKVIGKLTSNSSRKNIIQLIPGEFLLKIGQMLRISITSMVVLINLILKSHSYGWKQLNLTNMISAGSNWNHEYKKRQKVMSMWNFPAKDVWFTQSPLSSISKPWELPHCSRLTQQSTAKHHLMYSAAHHQQQLAPSLVPKQISVAEASVAHA